MAGVITTGNHPKALWPGIAAFWGRQYNEHPLECKQLFDFYTSEKAYEEDVEVTGFGLGVVKNEGGSISFDSETQGTINRATHVAYALGYIVTYEELKDNLYEVVSMRRSQANAFSMRQTKEHVAANVYNRAFDSNYLFGDGLELCSTAHVTVNGTQSNELATASDLSEVALEDLITDIMTATNTRGLKISLIPRSLHVHPNNWFEANRILKSTLQSNTADNNVNVLKMTNSLPEGIKVNHYFNDTDAWFIRTNAPRGMIAYQREEISFDQDNDFDTKNAKAAAYERYSFSIGDWRGLYGSPGA